MIGPTELDSEGFPSKVALAHLALATGPLDRRLALRSLVLALDAGFDVTSAAETLAALADGNRTALLRAIARVGGGGEERSGPTAERAAAALRLALARFQGPDTADMGFAGGMLDTSTTFASPKIRWLQDSGVILHGSEDLPRAAWSWSGRSPSWGASSRTWRGPG